MAASKIVVRGFGTWASIRYLARLGFDTEHIWTGQPAAATVASQQFSATLASQQMSSTVSSGGLSATIAVRSGT